MAIMFTAQPNRPPTFPDKKAERKPIKVGVDEKWSATPLRTYGLK
jgi:hypothetical protein